MFHCLAVLALVFESTAEPVRQVGSTIYVSKLGANADGSSWARAFTTIQAALDAVPDNTGGHRIVIRPDTYMEANLAPAHPGAAGAPNELIGDFDGSLGSGTSGWVVIDSGDPTRGFKSYDWWGTIRSYSRDWSPEHTDATFSAIVWDRWILRRLYATGGDGGLFFDGTNRVEPFSVLVEDCVCIGRAFGGGVASVLSRPEEPITYRRCHLWALDWWGDTAGGYFRVENQTMPTQPDAVLEDCVLVGPQCSLKASNFGFETCTRVALRRCRLATLNFSQPQGTPSDGIIQSVEHGRQLHVDLEDCTLMGYKVFGVRVQKDTEGDIGYTVKGAVRAYVQYQQEVPDGFHRLPNWPVDVFGEIVPPRPLGPPSPFSGTELVRKDMCELSPVLWGGRLCHMECHRPASGGTPSEYFLILRDAESGAELARFAEGHSLASAIVVDGVFHAFASRFENGTWNDVTLFRSSDLANWERQRVIEQENENLFNSSVCAGPDGYVMAYESNDPRYPAFTTKFARSTDLRHWEKLPRSTFGTNRYTACPCIRFCGGYYYVLYLERRAPRHYFETYITRSADLHQWELSAANPVIRPQGLEDGINASDPELVEFGGDTLVYYAVGDQLTWMNIKRGVAPGGMQRFLQQWYAAPGIPDPGAAGN